MVDAMAKFVFALIISVNFASYLLAFNMKEFEKEAEGSLEALDDIVSSFGGNDVCEFKCPNESDVKKPRPGHKPTSNGCGSFGIKLETKSLPEMTACCDEHDHCYDTCGNSREDCDSEFQMCLYDMCESKKTKFTEDQYEGCRMTAELMYSTTSSLGCHSYKTSQKEACMCQKKSDYSVEFIEEDEVPNTSDPLEFFDEEVNKKGRDILDVLDNLSHLLDLDKKDEL